MTESAAGPVSGPDQSAPFIGGHVQLRTLVLIRWLALVGQAETLLFVRFGLGFPLPLAETLLVVGAGAALNFLIPHWHAGRGRLDERSATLYFAFDIVQLWLLLYLTGGIDNPFTLMLVAPVAVSASVLSRGSTMMLCLLATAAISALAIWRHPLPWGEGTPPNFPPIFAIANWASVVVAIFFVALYGFEVANEARRMSHALAEAQLALAREQRVSAVGALAAATAHELGTPLATIAVVAKELSREVPPSSPLADDIALLVSQSERCRQILAELGHRPANESDELYLRMPLSALVDEVARRYRKDAVELEVIVEGDDSEEPQAAPSPEIMHGLGNFLANAAQFAHHKVEVLVDWTDTRVSIAVRDDGPGFPPGLLQDLGEPYVSGRRDPAGHLGLGIFIAQTLLSRTGAAITFRNRPGGGAEVVVNWQRTIFEAIA